MQSVVRRMRKASLVSLGLRTEGGGRNRSAGRPHPEQGGRRRRFCWLCPEQRRAAGRLNGRAASVTRSSGVRG